MEYNELKKLSKDMLIKFITTIQQETQKDCLGEREKWLNDILSMNRLQKCSNKDCWKVQYPLGGFLFCEQCDFIICHDCEIKSDIKIKSCECGIVYCSNCLPYCPH